MFQSMEITGTGGRPLPFKIEEMLLPQHQWLVCNCLECWHSVHQDQSWGRKRLLVPRAFPLITSGLVLLFQRREELKKFGREGLTLAKVSECSQLGIKVLPVCLPQPRVAVAELEWWSCSTWTLVTEGISAWPAHIAFLGKWKSRIPSNSGSSQHPIISSGPRKESANLFIWAAKWTGETL